MIAVVGFFFLFVLPTLCGLASYRSHQSLTRAGFAVIGGLFVLPAMVGALCAAAVRPAPRNEWS
jgi:hypothetical protein